MKTTERAAHIRQILKTHGWTSRDVSVTADHFSMGSAIRVKIKNADVPLQTVKDIATEHESIARCAITGDILSGGNRYVSVSYTSDAARVLSMRRIDVVKAAAAILATSGNNSLIDIDGTPYMLGRGRHGYGFAIWHHDAGHCCETQDEHDAALYVAIGGWNQ